MNRALDLLQPYPFEKLREETLTWLKAQDLACFFFRSGQCSMSFSMLLLALLVLMPFTFCLRRSWSF